MDDHTISLASLISELIDRYIAAEPDSDVNDALSALCMVLIALCKQHDVPRTEMLSNVNYMYEASPELKELN